ncbi:MAG: hypothetical protein WD971_07550 [Pirellulales bacterium]
MRGRTVKIVSAISWILLGTTVLLWLATLWIDPWSHHISLGDDFHIGVWGRGWDARLVIFSDAEYGPYRGSIIGLSDEQRNRLTKLDREICFGDSWGTYYRYFRLPDGYVLWTLMVSLWYPIIVFSMSPLIAYVLRLRRQGPAVVET